MNSPDAAGEGATAARDRKESAAQNKDRI
jgi:hypothetical protein